jgi:hypothetical protein
VIVRITRGEHPGGQKHPITRKDWLACYEADPELKVDGTDSIRWTGLRADEFCLLVWRDGDIEAIDPPPELEAKMAALAASLDANIKTHEKLHEDYLARKQPRRGPTHADPLTWQIYVYGFSAAVLLLVAIVLLMMTR